MAITDGRRDSGLDSSASAIKERFTGKGWTIALWSFVGLVIIGFVLLLAKMYYAQEKKLDALEAEKQRLEDKLDELSREKERLESKLEYTNSLEGLLQYARDNLGYIFPDDVRIEDGTGSNGD